MTEPRFLNLAAVEHFATENLTVLIRDGVPYVVLDDADPDAQPEALPQEVIDRAAAIEQEAASGQQAPRIIAMWRARAIMKLTPWGEGTLFEAVRTAITGLADPLQKAAAEEALDRGTEFDRDGVFVPMLAQIVGISDEQLDKLMDQAAALPA